MPMPNPIMPKPTRHPFTLADIMILIAAISLGLVGSRSFLAGFPFPFVSTDDSFPFRAITMSAPVSSALTLALIAVPVHSFRFRLRRAAQYPGMTACCGAAAALLMIAIRWAIRSQAFPYLDGSLWIYYARFTLHSVLCCGIGVMAALVVPVLAGCRRFRPDPIDWFRLAIGVYWIALFLVMGSH